MNNQLIAGIIAVFLPPIASFLKNVEWPTWKKMLVPLVLAVVVSLIVATAQIHNYWSNFAQNLGVTAAIVYGTYTLIWEKLGPVETWLREHGVSSKK